MAAAWIAVVRTDQIGAGIVHGAPRAKDRRLFMITIAAYNYDERCQFFLPQNSGQKKIAPMREWDPCDGVTAKDLDYDARGGMAHIFKNHIDTGPDTIGKSNTWFFQQLSPPHPPGKQLNS